MSMRQIYRACLVLFGGLLWVGQSLPARGQTRIGIFPFQSVEQTLSKRELISLSRKVLFQFDQNDLYKVVRKYPLTGGKLPPPPNTLGKLRNKELRISRRFLANAVKQMQNNDFEKVIPLLKLGITKASKTVRWKEGYEILARMCGLWALAAFRMGRGDEGELLLKVLARMNPNPPPPEIKANPQMRFRYHRAVRAILRGPKGSIRVIGDEGATIYVDNKKAGEIPKEVSNLPIGVHYVRVVRKGYEPWGMAVKVPKGGTTTITVHLKALPPPPSNGEIKRARAELISNIQLLSLQSDKFRDAAQKLCQHTKIQEFFTANLKKKGEDYTLIPVRFNCRDGVATKGTEIPVSSTFIDAELAIYRGMIALRKKQAPARRVALVRRQPPPRTPGGHPTGTPVYKAWWFWTLISVAVIGGGAAATTVILLNQPPRLGIAATW